MPSPTPLDDQLITFLLEHDDRALIDPANTRPKRSRYRRRHRRQALHCWPHSQPRRPHSHVFVLRVVPSREKVIFKMMRERLCEQPLPMSVVYPGSYGPPGVLWILADTLDGHTETFLREFGRLMDRQIKGSARRQILKTLESFIAS